jgi:hypothetical protein
VFERDTRNTRDFGRVRGARGAVAGAGFGMGRAISPIMQTIAERIKLTDVELMNLLTPAPRLVLRSAKHVVREYAGKFELYAVDASGLEMFVEYLAKE